MRYVDRTLTKEFRRAAKHFPAVILTGPRRAGKTTMLRHLLPRADYVLLEDPDIIARAGADPRGFLDQIRLPCILDEVQNVPLLFNYIRTRIDADPSRCGRWFLTGSQEAPLMSGVTESMAGRAAILQLLPFSAEESDRVSPFSGGFPEALAKPAAADLWFRSYIQTYLERDIRSLSNIRDLATFRRFIALLAARCGQMLNKTNVAGPLGVSVPTISQWLSMLEVTGQILLIPPFYENFGKRLVKTPKLYFADPGLLCHLLGIPDEKGLRTSPFLGAILENYVAAEVVKHRLNRGKGRDLYYFRDRQGLEVDFLLDRGNRKVSLLEVKATRTPMPGDGAAMAHLMGKMQPYEVSAFLLHTRPGEAAEPSPLNKEITSLGISRIHDVI